MLYLYEVKKIITQKSWIFAMVCSILLTFAMLAYEVSNHGFYNEAGMYEVGIRETRQLINKRQEMNGDLNDELVQKVITRYVQLVSDERNFDAYGNLDENKIAYQFQEFRDLGQLFITSLNIHNLQSIDIMKLEANDILLARMQQLVSIVNHKGEDGSVEYTMWEREKIFQSAIEDMKEKDSEFYEDATGWKALFAHLDLMNGVVLIISALIGSTLFCKEIAKGTSPLLYTTKKGRSTGIIIKIIAAFSVVGVSTLLLQGIYALGILWIFTPSGASTMIQYQVAYWLSIFPFTNLQAYGFQIMIGISGSMITLIFAMACSRYTRKEHHALILSLLFVLIPYVYSFPYAIFPADMSKASMQLMTISVDSLFQYAFFDYELQLLVLLFSFSLLLLIYHTFHKKRKLFLLE